MTSELPWEDALLERKLESDLKDLLKTIVAFANSVRPGHTAVILIGEKDDGSVQGVINPDNIQKRIRGDCDKVYPPIIWRSAVYDNGGKPCIRVEIDYSGETPHFAGPAWVRRGSETIPASDTVFQRLIELRLHKVRQLAEWHGKEITIQGDQEGVEFRQFALHGHPRWKGQSAARLTSVNSFYVTFDEPNGTHYSEPLEKLLLSWDHTYNRPKLLVKL